MESSYFRKHPNQRFNAQSGANFNGLFNQAKAANAPLVELNASPRQIECVPKPVNSNSSTIDDSSLSADGFTSSLTTESDITSGQVASQTVEKDPMTNNVSNAKVVATGCGENSSVDLENALLEDFVFRSK